MVDDFVVAFVAAAPAFLAVRGSQLGREFFSRKASWGLALCFAYFSLGHFILSNELVEMLPPVVPFRRFVIYATGIFEVLIAVMLVIPSTQRLGSALAAAALVLFLPANIYACINHVGIGDHQLGPVYLLIRLPLQILLLTVAILLFRLGETQRSSKLS